MSGWARALELDAAFATEQQERDDKLWNEAIEAAAVEAEKFDSPMFHAVDKARIAIAIRMLRRHAKEDSQD